MKDDRVFETWCGCMGIFVGIGLIVLGYALNALFVIGEDPELGAKLQNFCWLGAMFMIVAALVFTGINRRPK